MAGDRRRAGSFGAVLALIAGSAAGTIAPAHAQERESLSLSLPVETFTLTNGLRVFVHTDRSVPIVAVNLWYHVGSKDERPGRTGFAHLFEHLMFEGSAHVPEGAFDELLEAAGAVNNGSTTPDRTNYWTMVPPGALELALWLEADRMGWLLPAMTQEKLDTQRDVVKNERRQSYENRPYGLAWETLLDALYPPDHPYHWPTIGYMADLDAADLDDVRAFFRTYYAPNNATLALAGDVDVETARPLVERLFGPISRGPAVPRTVPPPVRLEEERRVVLEDSVQLPRLYMAWHSPAFFAPGDAELDAAAAILARHRSSRLYRELVIDREAAQDVNAFQNSGLLGSSFVVVATARPGVGLTELERAAREALAGMAAAIEPRELERARNHLETSLVDELQSVAGRADRFNLYAYFTGDPDYAPSDLERLRRLTPETVRDAVRTYLVDAPGAVLSVVPSGRRDLAAETGPGH